MKLTENQTTTTKHVNDFINGINDSINVRHKKKRTMWVNSRTCQPYASRIRILWVISCTCQPYASRIRIPQPYVSWIRIPQTRIQLYAYLMASQIQTYSYLTCASRIRIFQMYVVGHGSCKTVLYISILVAHGNCKPIKNTQ